MNLTHLKWRKAIKNNPELTLTVPSDLPAELTEAEYHAERAKMYTDYYEDALKITEAIQDPIPRKAVNLRCTIEYIKQLAGVDVPDGIVVAVMAAHGIKYDLGAKAFCVSAACRLMKHA